MSQKKLRRALGYPYQNPKLSYIFDPKSGTAHPWDRDAIKDDAIPVLAHGSNAAPSQLARKFARDIAPFPVARAYLADFDIVYAAQFTTYGSVPATLAPMPGALAKLHITFLTPAQLAVMHDTEALGQRYDFQHLTGLRLKIYSGKQIDHAYCYTARAGALIDNKEPIGIAERTVLKSPIHRLNQKGVQARCLQLIGGTGTLNDFILSNTNSHTARSRNTAALKPFATQFGFK